jgi:branched-chain amino acid transport system permease protein
VTADASADTADDTADDLAAALRRTAVRPAIDQRVRAVLYALAALALLLPLRLTSIPLKDFTNAVAMTVAVLGVNLMAGFVGRVALGHGAFVGTGAYTAVILSADHGWPLLATVPVAAVIGFALGLLVGLPALRVRGLHLALVTLGVGAAFGPFVKRLGALTNGPNGKLSAASWDAPTWFGEGRDANARWIYLTVTLVAMLVFVLARNLTDGRVGRSLVALRDGETAALTSGVDVRRSSIAMFGCSAAVAAIAGALLMIQTPYATISAYELPLSLSLYAAATVGGLARIRGALIGGAFLAGVPHVTAKYGITLDTSIIFGLALIAAVTLFPHGIASLSGGRLTRRLRSPAPRPLPTTAAPTDHRNPGRQGHP